MLITLPGKKVAEVEVLTTLGETPESEVSIASISNGQLKSYIQSGDFSTLYIQELK
jgi:hypothetical protein